MRRPQGYATITDPDRPLLELDTYGCAHCNRIVFVKPYAAPSESGGWCGCCAKPICGPCADRGVCTPFEQQLEQSERRDRLRRAVGV